MSAYNASARHHHLPFTPPRTRADIAKTRAALPTFGNGLVWGDTMLEHGGWSGWGVFAMRDFAMGELVTFVDGPLVTRDALRFMPSESCAWAAAHAHFLVGETYAIVGRHHPRTMQYIAPGDDAAEGLGGGAYVRDPRAAGVTANTEYVTIDAEDNTDFARMLTNAPADPRSRLIVLRARERILRGTELFVQQGMAYWSRPEQNPALKPRDVSAYLEAPADAVRKEKKHLMRVQ